MKKVSLLFLGCTMSLGLCAQFEYGTPIVEGTATLRIDTKYEEYCNGVLREKTEKQESYSSNLKGQVYMTLEMLEMEKLFPPRSGGLVGTRFTMNNFMQTYPEGATLFDGKKYNIPQYPVLGNYSIKTYGKDPCRNERECEEDFKTVLNYKEDGTGTASHHGHSGANFRASLVGVENCSKYFFLSFNSAGTWVEDGKAENSFIKGESSTLVTEYDEDKCKWRWEKDEAGKMMAIDINPQEASYNPTDDGSGAWIGSDGYYRRYEREDDGSGSVSTIQEELQLMRVDTSLFYRYLRDKPAMMSFPASGFYMSTYDDGYTKRITTIRYSGNITIGKKPGFMLEAENEDEFKNWLPGHPDYSESVSTTSIKASFDPSGEEKDSIKFVIYRTSRLPGICTNYPILAENPPKELADVYFAPQDKQTDPSIKILNDSTAITTDKVKSATVVIQTRDFGAHAYVYALSMSNMEKAICTYDNKNRILIPYDMNGNCIADKWEQDMGIEGASKLEDKDNLPTGQGREGDGLSVFEEYRGFICEKDIIASCDGGHTQRAGKHVRTSPLGRDVFVFDADGLFAKYVAAPNPAECHWHYVNREQMKLPPQDQVNTVVKASESDSPDAGADAVLSAWVKKEYRRINANSPDTLRNNLQFGMYLLTSPLTSSPGGATIFFGETNPGSPSPLRYAHLVILPQFDVLKKRMMGVMSMLMLNTTHKTLWDKFPLAVQEQVVQTAYEAMVPHEVGHWLGIDHHTKGSLTVINTKTKEKLVLSAATVSKLLPDVQYNEVFYFDGQEYLVTSAESAFIALGVTECCMRYTVEREVDFVEMKVLTKSVKYCKKGQTFTDGNGNKVESDNCFGKILIRCMK